MKGNPDEMLGPSPGAGSRKNPQGKYASLNEQPFAVKATQQILFQNKGL
jgi:hypothetical protein